MDSGNSGSISSSGDEEYDSRPDHTVLPSTFINNQFASISHPLVSSSHFQHQHQHQHHQHLHPSLFDLSSTYLHALSHSQQPNLNPFLNLDTATSSSSQPRRSEPDHCTDPSGVNVNIITPSSSSPRPQPNISQCLLGSQVGLATDNARPDTILFESSKTTNNVARNSKKRSRASRRAPTTVLTTDTSNFRAMVQEFTGIPAPPFSASSSYSRRLDLLTGSSSLRSSTSHLDTTMGSFYPLRPSPQKVHPHHHHHHHHHHQNPLLLSSSSSSPYNMVDAIASTTTTNNSSSNMNYQQQQQLPHDLGLPYHNNPQNIMLTMQNHPTLAFHPPPQPLHPFGHVGFGAKLPSIEDLGMSHGQVNSNANFVASGHVNSEGVALRNVNDDGGGRRDVTTLRSLDFSVASASTSLNHEKSTIQGNNNNSNSNNNPTTRGEGTVDSWICSSD